MWAHKPQSTGANIHSPLHDCRKKIKPSGEMQDVKSFVVLVLPWKHQENLKFLSAFKQQKNKKIKASMQRAEQPELHCMEGISCWEPFKGAHHCVMVVSAPSISKVNCYLINNLLLISKRCCSKCLNANGCVTHRTSYTEPTGQNCRPAQFVFSPEKKTATRKTLWGVLYASRGIFLPFSSTDSHGDVRNH